jgi:hypothetical protein
MRGRSPASRPASSTGFARLPKPMRRGMPRGSLTEMRIDIALVDAQGRIAIVENATMH